MKISRNKIYLDYAATTPMDKEVKRAMEPYFSEKFGNPGSLHSFGQEAMAVIDESREKIAKIIGADFREVIFTGSATEANNLALRGIVKKFRIQSLELNKKILNPRIIVSVIEHESILETCRDLEKEGVEIIYLPVNKQGMVDLKKLKESLNERIILVSIMYANNEIGIIQPIAEIAKIINDFKKNNEIYPMFHTDAVQAFQFLDCDVDKLGVDLMTLSAHKIYGPKGIGLLCRRIKNKGLRIKDFNNNPLNSQFSILNPIITGGGQEFNLRSGTENVPAIVGFAKAVELISNSRELENKHIRQLADYFGQKLKKIYPMAQTNMDYTRTNTDHVRTKNSPYKPVFLPNILNIYFPNQNAQDLLMKLDLSGIAVSSGSACSARATKISYVLKALGLPEKKIKSSLRFSFGKFTTKQEISIALKKIKAIL